MGPKVRSYSTDSIIYFSGDISDEIYVLQQGRVILVSTSLDREEEVKEDVQKGEFFGVKSALGHYPREETAQVVTETVVLVFKVNAFEVLCMKNPRIVLQMLKIFSSQLRKVHKKVREVLGESENFDKSIELLRIGEYYYKVNQTDYAMKIFEQFQKHYGSETSVSRVKQLITGIKHGNPYPSDLPSIENEINSIDSGENYFSEEKIETSKKLNESASETSIIDPPMDEFSFSEKEMEKTKSEFSVKNLYYEAINSVSQENYSEAIELYKKILNTKESLNSSELIFIEKACFDLGKALQKNGKKDDALAEFTKFVKKYPRSNQRKEAVFRIAEIYESTGVIDKAKSLYAKVSKMEPINKLTTKAEKRLSAL